MSSENVQNSIKNDCLEPTENGSILVKKMKKAKKQIETETQSDKISRKRGANISLEARKIIAHVYHFHKNELKNGVQQLSNSRWRTAQACGITERSVSRILMEERRDLLKPKIKKKNRLSYTEKLDENTLNRIRLIVQTYKDEHTTMNLKQLREILQREVNFRGSQSSVYRMLLDLGLNVPRRTNKTKATSQASTNVNIVPRPPANNKKKSPKKVKKPIEITKPSDTNFCQQPIAKDEIGTVVKCEIQPSVLLSCDNSMVQAYPSQQLPIPRDNNGQLNQLYYDSHSTIPSRLRYSGFAQPTFYQQ